MELKLVSSADNVLRLHAKGRIVQETVGFSDPMQDLLDSGDYLRGALLSLADVDYIDSSGIGWLLARHKSFRKAGGQLVLHSISPMVSDVVKMLRLDTVFHLADDEDSALALTDGNGRESHEL